MLLFLVIPAMKSHWKYLNCQCLHQGWRIQSPGRSYAVIQLLEVQTHLGQLQQSPPSLWCGGGHLPKECPEKGYEPLTPKSCNSILGERKNLVIQTYMTAAMERRSCCEGRCRKPWQRIHLGEYSLPGTQPQELPLLQQSAETSNCSYLSSSSHSPSTRTRQQCNNTTERQGQ